MKKTRNFLLAVTAIFVAALIGCGMTDDATVGTSDTLNAQRSAGLLTMDGEIPNFAEQGLKASPAASSARTIMPNDFTDASSYHYWLSGNAITGTTLAWTELTVDSNGKFKTTVAATAWDFVLLVTKDTIGPDTSPTTYLADPKSMFIGYAYADLSNSSAAVKFTVRPDGLTAGVKPTFTINFKTFSSDGTTSTTWTPDSYGVTQITAKICHMITGEEIDSVDITSGLNTATLAYSASTTVAPGTYNFILEFSYAPASTIVDYWSDVIVIVPNRTDYDPVVVPQCLDSVPLDVESLAAYWVASSRDLPGHEGFYKVNFQWDAHRVNNEKYFELEIVQLQNKKEPAWTDNAWTTDNIVTAATKSYTPENLLTSDAYSSGSMRPNAKQVTIYLPLGKAYFARIRAVNNRGSSKNWTYLTIPSGKEAATTASGLYDTYKTNIGGTGEAASLTAYITALEVSKAIQDCSEGTLAYFANTPAGGDPVAATAINTYRIRYHINGGNYMKIDDRNTTMYTDNVVYYIKADHLGTTAKTLWAANADNLKRGNAYFSSWCTEATGALVEETELAAVRVYKVIKGDSTGSTPGEFGVTKGTADTWNKTSVGDATSGYLGIAAKIAGDTNFATTTSTTTSADLEAMDDGGYLADDNLDLYADYTGTSEGEITIEDAVTEYKLYADMVSVDGTAISTQKNASTAKFNFSKASAASSGIVFSLNVPKTLYASSTAIAAPIDNADLYKDDVNKTYYINKTEDDALDAPAAGKMVTKAEVMAAPTTYPSTNWEPAKRLNYAAEKYDTLYMTIRDTRGNIMATKDVAGAALGADAEFGAVKIKNWATTNYFVEFTAVKTTSGKTITRSVSTVMELTD